MGHTMNDSMRQCIQTCNRCHEICLEALDYCLDKGGKHAQSSHIRLLLDCAEMCRLSADFMRRHSPQHAITCEACAIICLQCAASCDSIADDMVMSECARICRACATSCTEMAQGR